MNKQIQKLLLVLMGFMALTYYSSCKKTELVVTTTDDVNIMGYLKRNADKFSELIALSDKAGYSGFLNAYGAYTLFAPTNDAIKTYLQESGKTSVEQLSKTEAQDLLKLHLIEDTLTTSVFKDGKLPQVTMLGQYLVTGVTNRDGVSSYSINRQALVSQSNIIVGNGVIQVIDRVLKPATLTLAKMIEQNPEYSIFTQALKETRYFDSLDANTINGKKNWLTVLAETNQAYRDSGIVDYAGLKARYPTDSSLRLYVAYHILKDAKYLADIISASSHPTLAPLEVISSKLEDTTVLINDIVFNGMHEKGIVLNRVASDHSATNGVLHSASGHLYIKVRQPVPVYWDVADFPEIRKLPAFFRKQSYNFEHGSLKDFNWEKNSLTYAYTSASNFPVYWNDYLQIPLGLTNSARNKWVEMRTPILVKGRYKVWICYRSQKASSRNPPFPTQVSFNGEPMSRLMDFADGSPSGTDGELEALGWKRYSTTNASYMAGRLVGTIDVNSTDRHIIRFECISGNGQNQNNLDMIHFIPVQMDQVSKKFNRDGTTTP